MYREEETLTHSLPIVINNEFLLTRSTKYQPKRWREQEKRENINRRMLFDLASNSHNLNYMEYK